MNTRTESDSIGTLQVPADAYYGVQSLRARQNFPITGQRMHTRFIHSLAQIKKAAALTNLAAGKLDQRRCDAICRACDDVLADRLMDSFIVDPIQGGAGTSANMNANEVIANRAIELLGGTKGDYSVVHPNDHVNMAQSTNDVYPTAGKMTALALLPEVLGELDRLAATLRGKAREYDDVVKMGRTQLQDAVPIRLGQSFGAYASAVERAAARLRRAESELETINMAATAIGTAVNTTRYYREHIVPTLAEVSGLRLTQAEDLIDGTQNIDCFVAVSGALKACAVTLSKMANDLRLLSSGPCTGLGEISLPAKQNGSSIMPGKVNPVIPEVVTQVAFLIAGGDGTITMAAEAGQLELNAFEPVVFFTLFLELDSLREAVRTFTDNCVSGITANRERCRQLVEESVGIVTALCPAIGYQRAASLAKEALKVHQPVRKLAVEEHLLDEKSLEELLDPLSMTTPGD
ncbi:aspartate ammonia-lyase [bacterium 210820-DFI.6.52]|uniref:aspartate ammonia-lyase n=1 Tax=Bittarella massiliensis (ex Durand et al. 2017) TaxID=1720313 RepID=A0AAQ1RVC1_9FIRM|nr:MULTISPECIES: aspartate ammonia-lyase [Eubacteriales]MCB5940820.1 aspartate ammonia-lyase [bacterium 210820-DFI.6.52]ERI98071.1 putative aspartate ammonia-lyase [Clostridium sp. ATCC 29733]MZL69604.1 aspartate ammonia-lyase [Bittarella massiliensis (ex Durand et al. 2017)]MZL80521.1 aspartate ammonia-lyase [Bittarella massiliensis (ex Durand et al. 2017)]SHF79592.1 aspartate ammonia-lyase [Bittarella massiliensis (ex Durand et al. 2017)]